MKKIFSILILLLFIFNLTGCRQYLSKADNIKLINEYQFIYDNEKYYILDAKVSKNDLISLKTSFMILLEVNKDGKKAENNDNSKSTLAYGGIYNTNQGLAIAIQDSYYKIILEKDFNAKDSLFNIKYIERESTNFQLSVDSSDCRIILFNNRKYRITEEILSEDILETFQGELAVSKTFLSNTGRELTKSELSKIDWLGDKPDKQRTLWNYSEVYSIKGKSKEKAIAVNINDSYRLALLE